jgi:predicted MPP superfamily phosphohydrolase
MRRKTRFVIGILGLVLIVLGGWAFWWEPSRLTQKQYDIALNTWPSSCNELKIAVLSDLHVGSPHFDLPKLEEVVKLVNKGNPDVVLLGGDFVIHSVFGGSIVNPEPIAEELGKLEAKLGVYSVLGNHDWWFDGHRVKSALEDVGIPVLEDEAIEVEFQECRFWLVGIGDYWERAHDVGKAFRDVPGDAPVLVLTHNPDVFVDVPAIALVTFAGHTHGGQVNLPFLGPLVTMSKYGQRFAVGHIKEDGKHLIVSPGLGTSIFPIRFRVPPEISFVVLKEE